MKSVTAAEVAALGAWRALASGDRVGGIVFNDDEIIDLTPHRSWTRVLRLLHEVVRLNQALTRRSGAAEVGVTVNQVLEAALRRAAHDHLVVLISDFDGTDDETQRLATLLAAHNDMLTVGVYGRPDTGREVNALRDYAARWIDRHTRFLRTIAWNRA